MEDDSELEQPTPYDFLKIKLEPESELEHEVVTKSENVAVWKLDDPKGKTIGEPSDPKDEASTEQSSLRLEDDPHKVGMEHKWTTPSSKEVCSQTRGLILGQLSGSSSGSTMQMVSANTYADYCFLWSNVMTRNEPRVNHAKIPLDETPYKCETCGKCFSIKNSLSRHRNIHLETKPYKCTICTKCFSQSSHLSSHLKIHAGVRPHKCPTCGRSFYQPSHLVMHQKIHSGARPFVCEICKKCFTHRNSLSDHVKLHTGEKPYKCETCGKTFTQHNHLSKHRHVHTGERPYKCETCSKCFSLRSDLAVHLVIHSGQKPYKCESCSKCFTTRTSLRRHQKMHTTEDITPVIRVVNTHACTEKR